ncbi:cyclase family protein [Crocosphaera chwakensis]|uniref:Kynurenine formamidase n=1 Tax=Crocosphaera chwakensis CCY0110 TaxID=391612 RepID=A3IJZ9_9CHRO|nr:cyclase family protein [Crocosphaera chwakensis]EAZ92988.1 cyclase, putative [Crocosphaera chwakensis CCY0110]
MSRSDNWIDISLTIRPGMPYWPDNPAVTIEPSQCLAQGDVCNVSKVTIGTHTGTHVDGLNHFIQGAVGIDQMPLDTTIGKARVIEIKNPKQITVAEIAPHNIQIGERILFKTQNSNRALKSETFVEDFVHISTEAAKYLAEKKVRTVGVDYLSVGGYQGNVVEVHQALLGSGIWAIEGLNLSQVEPGEYELICLPIKLQDGDAGLARAILRPID